MNPIGPDFRGGISVKKLNDWKFLHTIGAEKNKGHQNFFPERAIFLCGDSENRLKRQKLLKSQKFWTIVKNMAIFPLSSTHF